MDILVKMNEAAIYIDRKTNYVFKSRWIALLTDTQQEVNLPVHPTSCAMSCVCFRTDILKATRVQGWKC